MQANPKLTLLLIDLHNSDRWMGIRGEVEITEDGTLEHLDDIIRQYTDEDAINITYFPKKRANGRRASSAISNRRKSNWMSSQAGV